MTLVGDTIRIMNASFEAGYYSCQKGIPFNDALKDFVEKTLPKSIVEDEYAFVPRERPVVKPWWKFW